MRKNNFRPRAKQEEHKLNKQIRATHIRLVGDNVEPGIYPIEKALTLANDFGLDLVEISPNASPPVCKILDYKKFLYEKKKKDKEIKKKSKKTLIKELRFGPNTDDHDFEFKAKNGEKFLMAGNKIKAYVQFRGRAIVFKDRGELLLLKLAKRLEEWGSPEQLPKLEGKRMIMVISPKKSK